MLCINKISFPCGTKMMDRASFPCFIFFTCFTHWRKFVQNFNSHQLTYFFRGTHIGILFLGKVSSSSHIFFSFQVHNYKYVLVVWRVVQNKWNKSCGLCPRTNMAREFSQKLGPYRGYLTNGGRNLTVSATDTFDRCLRSKLFAPNQSACYLSCYPHRVFSCTKGEEKIVDLMDDNGEPEGPS